MPRLGVNIDHVATLRQARGGAEPDPVQAALICEMAGADGIVVHLREDRRHIQDRDLHLLSQVIHTKLDLEMAATDEMVKMALAVKPALVTLVPERREERTTEGGLDLLTHRDAVKRAITALHPAKVPVSLFIEPHLEQVKAAHRLGAAYIELHTGRYAHAAILTERDGEFERLDQAAKFAYRLGMGVNAGHGLDYRNSRRLTKIPEIVEYNIGYSIIVRALWTGLEQAVREMKALVAGSAGSG